MLKGFADEIFSSHDVGKTKQYRLFNFVLNNRGSKRITCLIWGDELIKKYEAEMHSNRVSISWLFIKYIINNMYYKLLIVF